VTLPSFRDDASAIGAAREAERLGFDGVFVFDHLWPMGQPQRPALSAMPLLGAVEAVTERIVVGSLVARIGLLSDELLVASLRSLDRIAPGRFVAGIGTGDSESAPENIAFGISYEHADRRIESLRWCASRLIGEGVNVWIGGGSRPGSLATALAFELGATVNLWQASVAAIAAVVERGLKDVTWGGVVGRPPGVPSDPSVEEIARHLDSLAKAGVSWAVCVWPPSIEKLAEAVEQTRRHYA
jgi:alkanesulfonate monooxygenase SsuD/methylene tetrahydromethanopterin reductase-like flavin-dependent oxidoreductase (luciferase family)